jgi:hypothetical protein
VTIPAMARFIGENGLTFIGFTGAVMQDYCRRYPASNPADLDQWHAFETENPLSFVGMYQFWVQKPPPD